MNLHNNSRYSSNSTDRYRIATQHERYKYYKYGHMAYALLSDNKTTILSIYNELHKCCERAVSSKLERNNTWDELNYGACVTCECYNELCLQEDMLYVMFWDRNCCKIIFNGCLISYCYHRWQCLCARLLLNR